jgi:hypothetical protein
VVDCLKGFRVVVRSPYPDVVVPAGSLTNVVLEKSAQLGSKPAIVDGLSVATLTYAEW